VESKLQFQTRDYRFTNVDEATDDIRGSKV